MAYAAELAQERVLPLPRQSDENMPVEPAGLLQQLIPVPASEWAAHRLWIVEPGRVRIREGGRPAV